jgi:hypothetical protein
MLFIKRWRIAFMHARGIACGLKTFFWGHAVIMSFTKGLARGFCTCLDFVRRDTGISRRLLCRIGRCFKSLLRARSTV